MRTDKRLMDEHCVLVLLHWSLLTSAPLQPSRWRPSEPCPTWRCCWRPTAATSPSCRACFLAARATWTVCWASSWRPSSSTRERSTEPAASKAKRDPAPPCSHWQWQTRNYRFKNTEYPDTVLLFAARSFVEWRDFATLEFIYLRVISGADKTEETSQPLIKRHRLCLVVSALPFRPDLAGGEVNEQSTLFIWFLEKEVNSYELCHCRALSVTGGFTVWCLWFLHVEPTI